MTRTGGAGDVDRRLAALAAAVMLVGVLLPWFSWSGPLPVVPTRGFEGSGILVAVAAVVTLALLAVPWATRDAAPAADAEPRRTASVLDGLLPWLLVLGIAAVGLAFWPAAWLDALDGLLPDRAPGLYVALVGTVLLAVATLRRRLPGRR